ncbi:MAG: hypothetical protein JSV86_17075 [Gemmatimonadota bacterium]|nr:MAG: hypothetical protein JSV86_17075 [Gemmatimonadota bacterium]
MPLLNVLKNFANSEKAVAVGALILAATVLVILDRLSIQEWMEYTQVLAGIYVGGKALQGAASSVGGGKQIKAETAAIKMELAELRTAIASNDAAADTALEEKFEEE